MAELALNNPFETLDTCVLLESPTCVFGRLPGFFEIVTGRGHGLMIDFQSLSISHLRCYSLQQTLISGNCAVAMAEMNSAKCSWDGVSLEIQCVERDCLVAGAKFARFALEQQAMNAELEKDPNFSHDIMKSVLLAFRDFAEAKEVLELCLETAKACRAAHEGSVNEVMQWVEDKRNGQRNLPDCLPESQMTPLHCAVLGDKLACVSMLLGGVCDLKAVDKNGFCAAEYAVSNGEIASILKDEMAK